jgi:putative hydrolase of the HAD superfamily
MSAPLGGDARPDLRHVTTWLFDLDNTLYPLESGLAPKVSDRITDYVEGLTGLPREEARALQKRYLAEHGLTLKGLMANHGVDPDVFHAAIGDVDLGCLVADADLAAALARLPGRRLIFTNADRDHTQRVLERLGLTDLFEGVFHIADAAYDPKPAMAAFERIVAAHDIEPKTTAFFEDAERNLEPAALLGMTTVLVGAHAARSTATFVRYRTPALAPFLAAALI